MATATAVADKRVAVHATERLDTLGTICPGNFPGRETSETILTLSDGFSAPRNLQMGQLPRWKDLEDAMKQGQIVKGVVPYQHGIIREQVAMFTTSPGVTDRPGISASSTDAYLDMRVFHGIMGINNNIKIAFSVGKFGLPGTLVEIHGVETPLIRQSAAFGDRWAEGATTNLKALLLQSCNLDRLSEIFDAGLRELGNESATLDTVLQSVRQKAAVSGSIKGLRAPVPVSEVHFEDGELLGMRVVNKKEG